MTRRSVITVLASLLVALLVTVHSPTVSADGPCILDNQGNCATREVLVSVASTGPAVAVSPIDYSTLEAPNFVP